MNKLLYFIFIICSFPILLLGCKKDEDGKFNQINWELISNDNLEYRFNKTGVDVSAVCPGKIELSAINSPYLRFFRIKRDGVVQYDESKFSDNHSVYEDEAIRVELSYLSAPSESGTFTLIVKELSTELNYTIDVGLDYLYKASTIKLSIKGNK